MQSYSNIGQRTNKSLWEKHAKNQITARTADFDKHVMVVAMFFLTPSMCVATNIALIVQSNHEQIKLDLTRYGMNISSPWRNAGLKKFGLVKAKLAMDNCGRKNLRDPKRKKKEVFSCVQRLLD